MFRDGQYLEVIKVSDDCLATAVVTVQERTVEIKKRKVTTNKWLNVEDWAALYKILKRAVLRNSQGEDRGGEWRKFTRQLEVTYSFEHPECTNDTPSLPTIKVHVSPGRKKLVKQDASKDQTSKRCKVETKDNDDAAKCNRLKKTPEKSQTSPKKVESPRATAAEPKEDSRKKRSRKYSLELSDDLENSLLEEYIPDAPKKPCLDFKYVPSRKSMLETMRATDEYTPTLCDNKCVTEMASYVPNSIKKLETSYETYEPCATTVIPDGVLKKYVPNSKGVKSSVEEYEPNFKSPMKFDYSYVPSSVRQSERTPEKLKLQRLEARRKGTPSKKMDFFS